jgi:hypothetical protein
MLMIYIGTIVILWICYCQYYASDVTIGNKYLLPCGCGYHRRLMKVTVLSRSSLTGFLVEFEDGTMYVRNCKDFIGLPKEEQ